MKLPFVKNVAIVSSMLLALSLAACSDSDSSSVSGADDLESSSSDDADDSVVSSNSNNSVVSSNSKNVVVSSSSATPSSSSEKNASSSSGKDSSDSASASSSSNNVVSSSSESTPSSSSGKVVSSSSSEDAASSATASSCSNSVVASSSSSSSSENVVSSSSSENIVSSSSEPAQSSSSEVIASTSSSDATGSAATSSSSEDVVSSSSETMSSSSSEPPESSSSFAVGVLLFDATENYSRSGNDWNYSEGTDVLHVGSFSNGDFDNLKLEDGALMASQDFLMSGLNKYVSFGLEHDVLGLDFSTAGKLCIEASSNSTIQLVLFNLNADNRMYSPEIESPTLGTSCLDFETFDIQAEVGMTAGQILSNVTSIQVKLTGFGESKTLEIRKIFVTGALTRVRW